MKKNLRRRVYTEGISWWQSGHKLLNAVKNLLALHRGPDAIVRRV
jgi:hypothetical protein